MLHEYFRTLLVAFPELCECWHEVQKLMAEFVKVTLIDYHPSHFCLWLLYSTIGLAYTALVTFPYFNECKMKSVWWFFGFVENRVKSPVCEEVGVHPYIFYLI